MDATQRQVELHYAREGIAARILAVLKANGDPPVTPDALAPLDHFHSRGLQATKELAAMLAPRTGDQVLDIGCGIGGPARWIAANFGCKVTGIDLTAAFVAAATELIAACGLQDRVHVVQASAFDLPFPAGRFDRAYSQNVVMNIADKPAFYRQALRVLRPGGVLALANLCQGPGGPPIYPVPWADTPATSFLATPEQMRADLIAAGLEIVEFRDISAEIRAAQVAMRKKVEAEGLPPLGLHVLMGESFKERQINTTRSLEESRIASIEALVRKPG